MRKPAINNLKINLSETRKIRSSIAQQKRVKITINIAADTLEKLKYMSEISGIPYQRLINRILAQNLGNKSSIESRLAELEKELKVLKRKLA